MGVSGGRDWWGDKEWPHNGRGGDALNLFGVEVSHVGNAVSIVLY